MAVAATAVAALAPRVLVRAPVSRPGSAVFSRSRTAGSAVTPTTASRAVVASASWAAGTCSRAVSNVARTAIRIGARPSCTTGSANSAFAAEITVAFTLASGSGSSMFARIAMPVWPSVSVRAVLRPGWVRAVRTAAPTTSPRPDRTAGTASSEPTAAVAMVATVVAALAPSMPVRALVNGPASPASSRSRTAGSAV
ncbi:MAG: hypothetical protein EBY18_24340, partial [Alphaproteobacteria bacterium]|nr:hypothetical protein [Alphaproteobacteria bacterium]